ncbi:MAG: sigma-70 family RNA polymerase sigma factor [Verrucomicrobiota bacterium]
MAIPDTNASLLVQLRDPGNQRAWETFVTRYGPLVYGFGLRRGVSVDEADDFLQEVMLRVSRSIVRFDYDPEIGTFRSWLFQTSRHVLMNRNRAMGRRPGLSGGTSILRAAEEALSTREEARLRDEWDREYQRQVFAQAAERVRSEVEPESWDAFWRTAVMEEVPAEVATDLGVAVGTLYTRRSRVQARVRDAAREVKAEWEMEEQGRE